MYRWLVFKAYATSFTFDPDVKNRTLTAQGTKSLKDQHPITFINRQRGSDYLKSPNLVLDHYVYHFIRRSHVTTRGMLTFAAFDLRIYGHRCQDVAKLYIGSSCESNWTLSFCSTSDTFCVLKTSHETTWKYKYTSSYEERRLLREDETRGMELDHSHYPKQSFQNRSSTQSYAHWFDKTTEAWIGNTNGQIFANPLISRAYDLGRTHRSNDHVKQPGSDDTHQWN